MAKIEMNSDILNVINCVVNYKKFVTSYHVFILKENDFDAYIETEKFFLTLPLPNGMKHNSSTFENILNYANNNKLLNELNNTEADELNKFNWTNF